MLCYIFLFSLGQIRWARWVCRISKILYTDVDKYKAAISKSEIGQFC